VSYLLPSAASFTRIHLNNIIFTILIARPSQQTYHHSEFTPFLSENKRAECTRQKNNYNYYIFKLNYKHTVYIFATTLFLLLSIHPPFLRGTDSCCCYETSLFLTKLILAFTIVANSLGNKRAVHTKQNMT
jgi:hypothetical protein